MYGPTSTTWGYEYMPEDKTPLELRPSLERGEDSHVRDCLVWHTTTPRQRLQSIQRERDAYQWRTRGGFNGESWQDSPCGQPNCRSCDGVDHLTERQVGYVRRNELGRTIYRGFSSKPDKLKTADELIETSRGSRYEPPMTYRDPFNRPVKDSYQPGSSWRRPPDEEWKKCCGSGGCCGSKTNRGDYDMDRWKPPAQSYRNGGDMDSYASRPRQSYNDAGYSGYNGTGGGSGQTYRPDYGNELNAYRQTFPRIDEKDPGAITYRAPATSGPEPQSRYRSDYQQPPPPPQQVQTYSGSGYQPQANMDEVPAGAAERRAVTGGGGPGGGGPAARGNEVAFPRQEQKSSKPASQRQLKGQNEPVRFNAGY